MLHDIYEDISGLIPDSQLKTYIVEQRISCWKIKDSCSNFIEKVGRLFDSSNKDGNAVNVRKFTTEKVNIKKGDLAKSRMSSDLLQKHIDSANVLIDQIKSKLSLLFDSKNCVKYWKLNELKFLDEKLDTMNEKLKEIQKHRSIILATTGNIQSRLSNQSDIVAEKERSLKKRRKI